MCKHGFLNQRFAAAAICLGFLGTGTARATVYYEYELAAQTGTSALVSIEGKAMGTAQKGLGLVFVDIHGR